jgi:hypothetical protein
MAVEAPGEAELEKLVAAAIRRHANVQTTIVPMVIEKTGWDWERCEQYINQVQKDYAVEISFWQSNAFTIAGFVFMAIGFAIILITIEGYIGFARLIDCLQAELADTAGSFNECLYSGLISARELVEFCSMGVFLILGGIAGIVYAKHQLKKGEVMRND